MPLLQPAADIDAVIAQLEAILAETRASDSPLGYFPALYLRVTRRVKEGIAAGEFENGPRMERLDVVFANRYIEAYQQFKARAPLTDSWQLAFESASDPKLIVLQHLVLGMNAHINLDLGIAAQEVADDDILSLKTDFIHINAILGSLIDDTQARLTRFISSLGIVDVLLGNKDEKLALFSLEYARDKAWLQAVERAHAKNADQRAQMASLRDQSVARFGMKTKTPRSFLLKLLLRFIRLCEKGSIRQRIDWLAE